jgi:hypothetical protein
VGVIVEVAMGSLKWSAEHRLQQHDAPAGRRIRVGGVTSPVAILYRTFILNVPGHVEGA